MKTLKAEPTVVVRGWFKKRYYLILPNLSEFGVFELPVETVKQREERERLKREQAQQQQTQQPVSNPPAPTK